MKLIGWVTRATGITFINSDPVEDTLIISGKHTLDGLNRYHNRYKIRGQPVVYFTAVENEKVELEIPYEELERERKREQCLK